VTSLPLETLLAEIWPVRPRVDSPLPELVVSGVSHDSRRVRPGDVFVCLPGQAHDGHAYALAAVESGAVLVVGEKESIPGVESYVRVGDARRALALLARALHGHPSAALRLAGVTGTNGKSSVTWLIASAMRAAGWRAGVMGTLGSGPLESATAMAAGASEWKPALFTTPEADVFQAELARWRALGLTAGAVEVSSHALALRRTWGTRFSCVVFTNLSPDHLDFHETLDAYLAAKAMLFRPHERGPENEPAIAVIHADDPAAARLLEPSCQERQDRVILYGRADMAHVRLREARMSPTGIEMRVHLAPSLAGRGEESEFVIRSPLIGTFQVDNLLAAFTASLALGVEPAAACAGLGALEGIPGRMERVDRGQPFPVVVDYAHTPDALRRACESLRPFTPGRLLLVFGCGGDRDRIKRPMMGAIAGESADWSVVTDDNPRTEDPSAIRAEVMAGMPAGKRAEEIGDRGHAIARALAEARPGDTVLIAGKGHETYQERHGIRSPFDDRAVAAAALAGMR